MPMSELDSARDEIARLKEAREADDKKIIAVKKARDEQCVRADLAERRAEQAEKREADEKARADKAEADKEGVIERGEKILADIRAAAANEAHAANEREAKLAARIAELEKQCPHVLKAEREAAKKRRAALKKLTAEECALLGV